MKFTGERLIPKINDGCAFFYEHILRYFFACQYTKNKIVLDAGCGAGYGSYLISKYGQSKLVEAIDISKETIKYAKSQYSEPNINFHTDNILVLKTIKDKTIDVVTNFEVIEHIKEQDIFLKQIKRVLKNDGVLIISTPNILNHPKGNKYHLKELKPNNFNILLKKYFKKVSILSQNFYLTQEINSINNPSTINLKTKNSFFEQNIVNLKEPKNIKNSEYLVAICSDKETIIPKPISLSLEKVDNFDLSKGIRSLYFQFNKIKKLNNKLKLELIELKEIKDSKFYKLWPIYCRFKKIFIKK